MASTSERNLQVAYTIRVPLALADRLRAEAGQKQVSESRHVLDLVLAHLGAKKVDARQLSIEDIVRRRVAARRRANSKRRTPKGKRAQRPSKAAGVKRGS